MSDKELLQLAPIDDETQVTSLNCEHKYHNKCIHIWVASGKFHCPLCRAALLPVEVDKISNDGLSAAEWNDHIPNRMIERARAHPAPEEEASRIISDLRSGEAAAMAEAAADGEEMEESDNVGIVFQGIDIYCDSVIIPDWSLINSYIVYFYTEPRKYRWLGYTSNELLLSQMGTIKALYRTIADEAHEYGLDFNRIIAVELPNGNENLTEDEQVGLMGSRVARHVPVRRDRKQMSLTDDIYEFIHDQRL
jgi:hypothetical protein